MKFSWASETAAASSTSATQVESSDDSLEHIAKAFEKLDFRNENTWTSKLVQQLNSHERFCRHRRSFQNSKSPQFIEEKNGIVRKNLKNVIEKSFCFVVLLLYFFIGSRIIICKLIHGSLEGQ